jgi:hypothetical protein
MRAPFFGDSINPTEYNKKDILQYAEIASRGNKNPFNGFAIVEIQFKDEAILKIPNLLIYHSDLEKKLIGFPKIEIDRLPFLRK